jgi:hypothetical protein
MTIEVVLQAMQTQLAALERFIEAFAASLDSPKLRGSEGNKVYR